MTDGLDVKFKRLMKIGVRKNNRLSSMKKCALYDFNGTLVSMPGWKGHYEKKLWAALQPLRERKGGEKLAKKILKIISSPKRGTKARDIYYDFFELAVDRGEVKMVPYPDVFKQGNAIETDLKSGHSIISFSRGTQALVDKSMIASGTNKFISRMYSSIPYGGEKTADCYFGFFFDLLSDGKLIVKSYEDEWNNVEDMVLAQMALCAKTKMPLFPVYWVDRLKNSKKKEFKSKKAALGQFYGKTALEFGFKPGFNSLLKVIYHL